MLNICFGRSPLLLALLVFSLSACSSSQEEEIDPDVGDGHVVYHYDGAVYRIAAEEGALPQNISDSLNDLALANGEDGFINISPDGAWLIIDSERFHADCEGWSCLVRVPIDLSAVEPIIVDGQVIHTEGYAAIASGGDRVVYVSGDGPHTADLYGTALNGTTWSAPQLLTGGSNFDFHNWPAIDAQGEFMVFTCGAEPFDNTDLCEVGVDGSGFRTVLAHDHVPPDASGPAQALHYPDYTTNGGVVFEGDWGGEVIWRLESGASEPVAINPAQSNDNSPCVLPDGRIASLYLEHPDNPDGFHELKIMQPDGTQVLMLVTGIDIFDVGIGCGQ